MAGKGQVPQWVVWWVPEDGDSQRLHPLAWKKMSKGALKDKLWICDHEYLLKGGDNQ